ncbi:MAG: acyltransferase family protein [Acidovorax sp.]|uniref:acyltransferase family protein n=1 Tax=Acidovorax sp. TaxID=1872122 RepID=UPI0039190D7B
MELMAAQNPVKNDLHWIQALRGIAALMVLFFHMHPHWDLVPILSLTSGLARWGFSGVDIFFALSGFVVYRSAQRTVPMRGIWAFTKKRLLRIYLGYWPVLLAIALVTVYVHQEQLPALEKMVFSTLLLYPNIWDNWLSPAWSLTMEIYFYLWIGLIALLPARYQIKAIIWVMSVLAAWGIGWLLVDPAGVVEGRQPLRYLLTGLGLEFLAGALLAHFYTIRAGFFMRPGSTIPLCVLLMIAGLSLGMTSPFFDRVEVLRAISFGLMGLSALVVALTLEQTRYSPPRWLVAVGDASYSLYLLHTFLLDWAGRLRVQWALDGTPAVLPYLLAMPVCIVLISLLWYRWIEKPIMKAAL